jgi:recombinational DNA repair protein RecR
MRELTRITICQQCETFLDKEFCQIMMGTVMDARSRDMLLK